jgi:predicted TIM-barrel fold metal-dependent hydrolase
MTEPDEANWNNFKNNISDFSKLKGIHFWCEWFHAMEESDFYKSETTEYEELEFEIFYNIWPNRIQFLKSHGIQILNKKEFESIKAKRPNNLKWAFHFS